MTSAEEEKALRSETRAGGFLGERGGGTGPGPPWVREKPEVTVKEHPSAGISSQLPSPRAVLPGEERERAWREKSVQQRPETVAAVTTAVN